MSRRWPLRAGAHVTVEPSDQAELLEQAGDAAALSGRHESAERHFGAPSRSSAIWAIAPR